MIPDHLPYPAAASLWASTADPVPSFARHEGEARADIVIIGGGYTGLSAAHHIAKCGLEPLVLEANTVGWGASGRNGGVVSAKFRLPFPAIAAKHGRETAGRMYAIAHESLDLVEELVGELGIESAGFARVGHVKAAHSEQALAAATTEAEWVRAEMGASSVSLLSQAQIQEETGSKGFVGGVLTKAGAGIHPLNYLRGLASGVARRGVRICETSPALRIGRDGDGVLVETPGGTVRAAQAIIATNAYSDLTPATAAVQRRLVPFRSAIIATAPLSPNLRAVVLPGRRIYAETRRMMRWFRMIDDRVVFGGRGAFGKSDSATAFRGLQKAMVGLFPMLEDVPVDFRWSGLVAMTLDQVPHVGRLDDRLLVAAGYNGAGVAMSTLLGKYLAAFVRREKIDVALLDAVRFKPVPFYPLREPAVRLVAGWYQFLDAIGR